MKPHFGWGTGWRALAGCLAFSICALTSEAISTEVVSQGSFVVASHGSGSANDSGAHIATYFTINSVLAKHDGRSLRRSDRDRVARLPPSSTAIDARRELEVAPTGEEPYGLPTFRSVDRVLQSKWDGVKRDMAKDQSMLYQCRADPEDCPAHARQFLRLINAVKAKHGLDQLKEVNQAVNAAIRYTSDMAQFGEADRWSTALATFATGKGDCEDYVLAKYAALEEAGFPKKNMRILLVRDTAVRMDHAVLAVRHHDRWLIMDNRWSDLRHDTATRTVFTPLFTIGLNGIQMFAKPFASNEPRRGHKARHAGVTTGHGYEQHAMPSHTAPVQDEERDEVATGSEMLDFFSDGASAPGTLLF